MYNIKNDKDLRNAYTALLIMLDGDIKKHYARHERLDILKREIRAYIRG